ncbi:MAG: YeeE/YedE family protein [Betaproteobacteria bacterium]|nr:YeeE/YedE family protein [Betaproteobacteria bacterium]
MEPTANLPLIVTGGAFALAFVFGAVANRVNFCTMGAVSDIMNFGDWRRMRMWMLAVAVAIAGATALQNAGLIDLSKSFYTGSKVSWLSALVGGWLFGFGMTLGSGCGSKTLIRMGGGNLKSLVVLLFLAVSAYMTLKGLFAVWRANGLDPVRFDVAALGAKTSDLATVVAALGLGAAAKSWVGFAVAAALAAWVFANREFRTTGEMIFGGVVIGAVVVGGWYVTAHLGYVAEDPQTLEEKFVATTSGRAESFSFTGPVAATLELLLFWTDQSRALTFGIAGELGMAVGSLAMALLTRSFRWEGFASVEDPAHHIVGGTLMGFGGVTALGCTIGQGLSGISTLSLGSFIALASIIVGSMAAMKYQMWRLESRRWHWLRPSHWRRSSGATRRL